MSLMTRGMSFLTSKLGTAAGITIVITPLDGLGTITVTDAVAGRSEIDVTQPGQANARREYGEREYLIPVASLVRNGSTVFPALGDRYAETINGRAHVYQIMPADGRPAYDFTDHGKTQVRIRTKKVSG